MDGFGDSGWIRKLPEGWIDGFTCARRLLAWFGTEYANADPAPWHDAVNAAYWGPHFGKTPAEYALNEKLSARLVATIQKAVCSGQLAPSWFDGSAFKSIPAHAFSNWRIVHGALLHGRFEVDPLWPDDWQHWSNHGWAIPKEQFELWMQSDHALSMAGLPVPASEMPSCDVVSIASRKPTDASRIPLSEAITWIAFGVALDAERLERAIRWQSFADGDLQADQRQMEAATATLLKAGADGLVPMYGRHMEAYGEKGKLTQRIDPLTLEDYRKALIISHDNLYYGEGLFVWHRAPNDSHVRGSERGDHFVNVTVERDALLKHFGLRLDLMAALLMPIPAALPEVGSVMGLAEAVSLLTANRPVSGTEIWEDPEGNWHFFDLDGNPLENPLQGEVPRHLKAFNEANRRLWDGLRKSELRTFVAADNCPVLSVPPLYWNPMNPECLEYVYRGTSTSDAGRGWPVLLARLAFEEWRAAKANPAKSRGNVPPNRQLDHDAIRQRASELLADQPNLKIGPAAASIIAELGNNRKTGKPWDNRHIERLIAPLWYGG